MGVINHVLWVDDLVVKAFGIGSKSSENYTGSSKALL